MKRSALGSVLVCLLVAPALGQAPVPPIGPDELAFSVENMDTRVSPAQDFYRYASGAWQVRVERPARLPSIGVFEFMNEHVKAQMERVVAETAADARNAVTGSPEQQVGDFYNAYMDVERIDAAGIEPLRPELARIADIQSLDDLAHYIGHYARTTGNLVFVAIVPSADKADSKRTALYAVSGAQLVSLDLYKDPNDSPRVAAYLAYAHEVLELAGDSPEEARRTAQLALEIDRTLHAAKITPVEAVDPRNSYNPLPFADLQRQVPELDLSAMLAEFGIEVPETVIQTEPRYLAALSGLLRDKSLKDIKAYLRLQLIAGYSSLLSRDFQRPLRELTEALAGLTELPPREETALALLAEQLGHPLSQLYVERFFTEEARQKGLDMIGRIKQAFLQRMKTRTWLSEPTREAAIDKLEKLIYRVGYPDTWIDFSGVEVTPNDVIENDANLTAFDTARQIDRIGKPVLDDQFADSATLPIRVNAGYNPLINGFEVPAAILQPGIFEPDKPAPVYFCRLGAVLGHEMTHGFDSGGRLFDAQGNLRDWWTPKDAAAFDAQAQKLVDQANSFQVLPGLTVNGALTVGENMADVGGITLAHTALMDYLADHPEEDKTVGGLTPTQQCFVAWAQMWTAKSSDQYLQLLASSDNHAPGAYRAVAALQHLDAFYEAFDIKEGDPMWLPPEKRVNAW